MDIGIARAERLGHASQLADVPRDENPYHELAEAFPDIDRARVLAEAQPARSPPTKFVTSGSSDANGRITVVGNQTNLSALTASTNTLTLIPMI